MADAAFLDTGVVLGVCFRDDTHHQRCQQYVDAHDGSLYISDHVESEYLNREPSLAEEIADGVFAHIDRLQRSGYEGQLDSMDTSQIRQDLITNRNPAAATLTAFYKEDLPNFILITDIISRLRDLARDIEQSAIEKRTVLLNQVEIWEREAAYNDLDDQLAAIPWDDRRICLDAHDVATVTADLLELATTNPTDLVADGYRELIIDVTSIEDVVSVAKGSSL